LLSTNQASQSALIQALQSQVSAGTAELRAELVSLRESLATSPSIQTPAAEATPAAAVEVVSVETAVTETPTQQQTPPKRKRPTL